MSGWTMIGVVFDDCFIFGADGSARTFVSQTLVSS